MAVERNNGLDLLSVIMKLDINFHLVFKLTYHLVLVVKYRRKVINEHIAERIREIGEYISHIFNFGNMLEHVNNKHPQYSQIN